jgi:hypothetical protein
MSLRERARQGRANLSPGVLGQLGQAAAAAGIAWELALQLPNHGQPFFAPVAAVIALGAERGTRGRQAIRMMTGVSLGILVGALVLAIAGAGGWQIVVATAAALVIATGAGASQVVRNQAAASAILIVALHRPGSNLALQRFEDALIGGAVAIVIARFLLPIDPIPLVRDEARNLREQLAGALDEAAGALADNDRERAETAVERIWAIDDSALARTLITAREITRAAPRRRPLRRRIEKLGDLYRELEASVYDSHAIATGVVRLSDADEPVSRQTVAAIEAASAAVRAIEPNEARAAAESARNAARALRETDPSLGAAVTAHGIVGVAEHTLRAAKAREEERRLAESRRRLAPFTSGNGRERHDRR